MVLWNVDVYFEDVWPVTNAGGTVKHKKALKISEQSRQKQAHGMFPISWVATETWPQPVNWSTQSFVCQIWNKYGIKRVYVLGLLDRDRYLDIHGWESRQMVTERPWAVYRISNFAEVAWLWIPFKWISCLCFISYQSVRYNISVKNRPGVEMHRQDLGHLITSLSLALSLYSH